MPARNTLPSGVQTACIAALLAMGVTTLFLITPYALAKIVLTVGAAVFVIVIRHTTRFWYRSMSMTCLFCAVGAAAAPAVRLLLQIRPGTWGGVVLDQHWVIAVGFLALTAFFGLLAWLEDHRSSAPGKTVVTFELKGTRSEWSTQRIDRLIQTISERAADDSSILLKGMDDGSVLLTIEVPDTVAARVRAAIETGVLADQGVLRLRDIPRRHLHAAESPSGMHELDRRTISALTGVAALLLAVSIFFPRPAPNLPRDIQVIAGSVLSRREVRDTLMAMCDAWESTAIRGIIRRSEVAQPGPHDRQFVVDFEASPARRADRPGSSVHVQTWQEARDALREHLEQKGVARSRPQEVWTFCAHGTWGAVEPNGVLCEIRDSLDPGAPPRLVRVPALSAESLRLTLDPRIEAPVPEHETTEERACRESLEREIEALREILVLARANLSDGGTLELAVSNVGRGGSGDALGGLLSALLPGVRVILYERPVAWRKGRLAVAGEDSTPQPTVPEGTLAPGILFMRPPSPEDVFPPR